MLAIPPSENQHGSAASGDARVPPVLDGLERLARPAARHVQGMQRDGADQQWEAQAHARRHDDGQVVGCGERPERLERLEAAPTSLSFTAFADRRRMRLHPRDDRLRKETSHLGRVEEKLVVLPGHPVRAAVREVRRHHGELDALRTEVAECQRPVAVLRCQVVDQLGEPRRQRRGAAVVGREPAAQPELVPGQRGGQSESETHAECDCKPQDRQDDAGDDSGHRDHPRALEEREHDQRNARRHPGKRGEREAA